MPSTNFVKRFLLIAGRVLILLLVLAGAVRSGTPVSYYESLWTFLRPYRRSSPDNDQFPRVPKSGERSVMPQLVLIMMPN